MISTLVTGPSKEPLDLATDVKPHLRIVKGDTTEDSVLTALITTSKEWTEEYLNRKLITQTWQYFRDDWPDEDYMELPYGKLSSVTHVKYTDSDETTSTMSSGDYTVDTDSDPGRIVLDYGKSWPSSTLWPTNPIEVQFVCGYGDSASDIPKMIRQAMLMMIAHWWENREAFVVQKQVGDLIEVPKSVTSLLYSHRLWSF